MKNKLAPIFSMQDMLRYTGNILSLKVHNYKLQQDFTIYQKERHDDCSIQAIRGVLNYYGKNISSHDLYNEFVNKEILSTNHGLIYKRLTRSIFLERMKISCFRYFPILVIGYYLSKNTPVLVSIKTKKSPGHIVTIVGILMKGLSLKSISYADSTTGNIEQLSGKDFQKIYNSRGFLLYPG